jgi:hypothetical protein
MSPSFNGWSLCRRSPFTMVPLVEPRSRAKNPVPAERTSVCRRLTLGSDRLTSHSGRRPMMMTGLSSGMR